MYCDHPSMPTKNRPAIRQVEPPNVTLLSWQINSLDCARKSFFIGLTASTEEDCSKLRARPCTLCHPPGASRDRQNSLTTHVCLYGHCRAVVACRLCGPSAGTSPVLLSSCTTTSLVPPASRSPPPRPASSLQRCRGCGSYTGRMTIPWSVATWQDNGCRHVLWTSEIYHDVRLEGCILI
jgi:hypothetical protein